MAEFFNITGTRSSTDAVEAVEAFQKNNAALVAERSGRHDETIRLHT